MKILILDPGFEYSTLAVAESYYNAFVRLGYEVEEYDTHHAFREASRLTKFQCPACKENFNFSEEYNWNRLTEIVTAPILNIVVQDRFDVVIAIHGYHINPVIINSIRKIGCKTALVLTDEPQQMDITKGWSQFYDYNFSNDKGTANYHHNGYYLPMAADERIFKPQKVLTMYESDILVGGSFYRERFKFLMDPDLTQCMFRHNTKFIGARKSNFGNNDIRNNLFVGNKISYEEMAKYTAGTKINVDIPRDEFRDGIFLSGNTKKIKATCLAPRIFESPLAGALVLTSGQRRDIFDLFPEGMFPIYGDQSHLTQLIEEYLGDEEKRKKLVEEQRKYCLENHTYYERAKEIAKVMDLSLTRKISNTFVWNRKAVKHWELIWRKNYDFMKKKEYYKNRSLESLKNHYNNGSINIVSNGPSLEKYVEDLNGKQVINMTVNDAFRYIDCQYYVVIHPDDDVYERCVEDLDDLRHKETMLLASSVVNYKVVEHWIKRNLPVKFFGTSLNEEDSIKRVIRLVYNFPILDAGYSVGYSAITCALYMGLTKEINVYGLDFCYKNMKRYAFEEPIKFKDALDRETILLEDAEGNPVLTDSVLIKSRDLVLDLIRKNPNTRFNIYGGGLLYSDKIENLIVHV